MGAPAAAGARCSCDDKLPGSCSVRGRTGVHLSGKPCARTHASIHQTRHDAKKHTTYYYAVAVTRIRADASAFQATWPLARGGGPGDAQVRGPDAAYAGGPARRRFAPKVKE